MIVARAFFYGAAMIIFLSVAVWFVQLNSPDPRFNIDYLRGKSPAEVVRLLGKPRDDPRLQTQDPWTPEKENLEGPLVLVYRDEPCALRFIEHYYGIVFRENKVYQVTTGHS